GAGIDVATARADGQYISLDAEETLSQFMVGGSPEPVRFFEVIDDVITRTVKGRRNVRIFGEMVALLWVEGNRGAAIRLEALWNSLLTTHSFLLFCAYPIDCLSGDALSEPLKNVCAEHAHIIPAESYAALTDPDDRLRAIVSLQQKAISL